VSKDHPPRIRRLIERHPASDMGVQGRVVQEPATSMTDPTRGN
jgi:hypothetical protein